METDEGDGEIWIVDGWPFLVEMKDWKISVWDHCGWWLGTTPHSDVADAMMRNHAAWLWAGGSREVAS